MGGSESGLAYSKEDQGYNPADIEAFINTGYAGAEKLRGGVLKVQGESNPIAGRGDLTYTGYTGTSAPYSGYRSVGGTAINDQTIKDFEAWRQKNAAANGVHDEYLKLTQDRPGRQATILTPMSGPESKTLLGAPYAASKTVLG